MAKLKFRGPAQADAVQVARDAAAGRVRQTDPAKLTTVPQLRAYVVDLALAMGVVQPTKDI